MDAYYSSIVADVMATEASVPVGSIAEGKCLGYQYEVMTLGLDGGDTDVRGVPKRHKADLSGRHWMRMALPSNTLNWQVMSDELYDSYEHQITRQL